MKKRKAILVYPKNSGFVMPLSGPENDVANWRKFLTSSLGGAWEDQEIEVLNVSNAAEIIHCLTNNFEGKYDYVFFAFFGHGAFDESNVGNNSKGDFLYCSSFSAIYLDNIKSLLQDLADRALLFVDCCRSKAPSAPIFNDYSVIPNYDYFYNDFTPQTKPGISPLSESVQRKKIQLDGFRIFFEKVKRRGLLLESRNVDMATARNLWWSKMSQTEGVVVIHSCSIGECAYECEIEGKTVGLFTYLYINSASGLSFRDSLSSFDAFKATENKPNEFLKNKERSERQHPKYDCSDIHYPFAVYPRKMETFFEFLDEECYKKIEKDLFRYNCANALFEHFDLIPGTNQSYVIHKEDTLSKTVKHAHVYAKPKGKGGEMYSIRVDGKGHDGSKGFPIPLKHQEFFRSKGFVVPESGILECRCMREINGDDYSLYILLNDSDEKEQPICG